jgi:integrase
MARARRGRGEGGVYQRESDGLWAGSVSLGYDASGARKRRTVYGNTKAEVLEKLRKLQGQAARGTLPDSKNLTVGQFLDVWLAAVKPTVAPGTHATYEQHVRNLIKPLLGGVRIDTLKPLHVSSLYERLAASGFTTAMQRKAGITFRAAMSWAVTVARLIPHNPVRDVKMPAHRPAEVRALEPDQLAAFIAAAKRDRLYSLYVLALDSGCRQGELLALTWRDIDLDQGIVVVRHSLEEVKGQLRIKEPKREAGRRSIAISPFALDAIRRHRDAMGVEGSYRPDGPVFCGSRNRSWLRKSDVYRHSFEPVLKAAGLSFKFHALRHTCASFLLTAGADVKTVQERLGHSTAVMTLNIYSHVLCGAQVEAAKKMNAVLATAEKVRGEAAKAIAFA